MPELNNRKPKQASLRPRSGLISPPLALMLMGTLAGCVVGPDYHTPVSRLPAHWGGSSRQTPERPAELHRWWSRMGDRTLDALIESAVAGNLDVASAKAAVREARASYRGTVGELFPSVTGDAAATRSKSVASSGSPETDPYNQFQAGFDASWELDLFGANRRSVEAARYGLDAAAENLRDTLLTLIGDVAQNYVEARGYQARIALAQRTAASQQETADLTETKFEAGSVSQVDVASAAGQAASTAADIPTLRSSFARSVHRLSVLTGQPPAALAELMRKSAPVPAPAFPIAAGIPSDILLSRPDVRLAERQLAQSTARIGQAQAALYPSISLTGDIATSGTKIGDLAKSSSIGWSFGPSLTIPVFDGGKLRAAVQETRAQRDQYFFAYHASVLTALEDVENALVDLAQQRIRTFRLSESVDHYREAAKLTRLRYQSGTIELLDVLDVERSLYSAEDALIQSRIDIALAYVSLNKALGGGWDGFIDASTPAIVDTRTGPHLGTSQSGGLL